MSREKKLKVKKTYLRHLATIPKPYRKPYRKAIPQFASRHDHA